MTGAPCSLQRRWQRLQLQVRCALDPERPALVTQYLACGTLLSRRSTLPAVAAQQRMLHTLLQTGGDAALPWSWRSTCLEHATEPLARLSALLRLHDPLALAAWEAALHAVRDRLPRGHPSQAATNGLRTRRPAEPA